MASKCLLLLLLLLYLCQVGGSCLKELVYRIMTRIMSNDTAMKYNRTGLKGKEAFLPFELVVKGK